MLTVPLQAVAAQNVTCTLGGQNCQITVQQKATGLFLTLEVANSVIVASVLCHNNCLIVRDAYLGFVGDLTFFDTQGTSDPAYDGLGGRYLLVYLEASDL